MGYMRDKTGRRLDSITVARAHHGALPEPVVTARRFRPNSFQNLTGVTFRRVYQLAKPVTSIRLVYQCWAPQGTPLENAPGAFTVKAQVLWRGPSGVRLPVMFAGQRTATGNPYAMLISDPIPVDFNAAVGSYFVVDSYVTTAGAFVPVSGFDSVPTNGWTEGYLTGDQTDSATVDFSAANATYGFGPIGAIGTATDGSAVTVLLSGDSIINDSGTDSESGAIGFAAHALWGAKVPCVAAGRGGEAVQDIINFANSANRMNLAASCTHALDNYGTNDIGTYSATAATLKANLLTYWAQLAKRGVKLYRCTINPRNTSTDSFQTVSGQGLYAGTGPEAVRQAVNQWLRAPASAGAGNSAMFDAGGNLAGVFDTAAALEVNADGSAITINPATGAISNGSGGYTKADSTAYATGTVTSIPSSGKLQDTTKAWTTNQWLSYYMLIVSDTTTPAAAGQLRLIAANNANTLTTDTAWTTTPSTAATYRIIRILLNTDGIHPTTLGHRLIETKVDTSVFT